MTPSVLDSWDSICSCSLLPFLWTQGVEGQSRHGGTGARSHHSLSVQKLKGKAKEG